MSENPKYFTFNPLYCMAVCVPYKIHNLTIPQVHSGIHRLVPHYLWITPDQEEENVYKIQRTHLYFRGE